MAIIGRPIIGPCLIGASLVLTLMSHDDIVFFEVMLQVNK